MKSRKLLGYGIAGIVSLCCVCSVAAFAINIIVGPISTPTPLSRFNISDIVAQTAAAAQTQTQFVEMQISIPTNTVWAITEVSLPTYTLAPTATPFILPTQPLPTLPLSTQPPAPAAVCSCSNDSYNCGDFSTHAQAQACFDYCVAQGRGDIHKLDGNNDGSACENLP